MTLRQRIEVAAVQRDPVEAGRIAETLRHSYGMPYEVVRRFFLKADPTMDAADFEALMLEAENRNWLAGR